MRKFVQLILGVVLVVLFVSAIATIALAAPTLRLDPGSTESESGIQQSLPAFSKLFGPDTIGPGSTTTLTFTIDNGGNPTVVSNLAFTDNLPAGVTIADPANAQTDCTDAILDAPGGGSTIDFSEGKIGADAVCSASVNVTSSVVGTHTNLSGDLTSDAGNHGTATDDLDVVTNLPGFSKSFAPSSVPLGDRSTLTFTIDNTANATVIPNLDFTDNLPAGMEIADPANASTTCGTSVLPPSLTAGSGTSVITLDANGISSFPALAAGATCTVTVDVVATGSGMLENVSEELLAEFTSAGRASATLEATVTPLSIEKKFIADPAPPGEQVDLTFTINNRDRNFTATDIEFTDDLGTGLSGLTFESLKSNTCSGSVLGVATTLITFSGGTLSPEGKCTITVTLSIPGAATPGIYSNSTSVVTGTVDGSPVTGNAASDVLFVAAEPELSMEFIDDPVGAGESVVLEYTITNTSTTFSATDITFTDVFPTILPTASSTLAPGFCGAGSTATYTPLINPTGNDAVPAKLVISGAELLPGDSCAFSITLDIAQGAATGIYSSTTGEINATIDGTTRTGDPASDDLIVVTDGPTLLKEFTDDPVKSGATVKLKYTIANTYSGVSEVGDEDILPPPASDIAFTDDFSGVLSGLTVNASPVIDDFCGVDADIVFTADSISFSGGALDSGASCTFLITLQVPSNTPPGSYPSTTSDLTAVVETLNVVGGPAEDSLKVADLIFTKSFTDDPVIAGGTVTLEYTIKNESPTESATGILFQDNLDTALDNLAATNVPQSDICGTGSSLVGSSGITLFGGSLDPGQSCTISVSLQVPAAAASDSYVSTTNLFQATVAPQ